MMSALQLLGRTPDIHLFVVSIESIQQQGLCLSPEIERIMPELLEMIENLVSQLSAEKNNMIFQGSNPV